jgi:hypothetical protein
MGQAAGTAADLALKKKVAPRAVDVRALQRRLAADGANLGPTPAALAPASKASAR